MEITNHAVVKDSLEAALIALARASTHLRNATDRRTLWFFGVPVPIGWVFSRKLDKHTTRECSSTQEHINEAREHIEELINLLTSPPPSYEYQTDIFRRAIMSNVLVR
jgi:hypothetical protein